MPSLASPDVIAVVDNYTATIDRLRTRLLAFVTQAWEGLDEWRDADIEAWSAQVIPVVSGAQRQVAALTDAYLAQLGTLVTEQTTRPLGVSAAQLTTEALRGVPAADVYLRPGQTAWTSLSQGDPLDLAVKKGGDRAIDIASTDLQLAKTHTARNVMESDKRITGYRRVLEGSRSCGLCIVASTQRYHKKQLMPIHPGCDCGVLTIYGDKDPGQVIDHDTIPNLTAAIEERFGASSAGARFIPGQKDPLQYRDVLVTHEHGEIGPVLGIRGQDFTSPNDL